MNTKTTHQGRPRRGRGHLAANGDARGGPLLRLKDDIRVPAYKINMLDPENFTVALLGEFGFSYDTIARATNLSRGQVGRRLKFASVRPTAYRRGESVIAQMILKGVAKAGVPQLREFAEVTLANQLRQLGWSALAEETPEPPLTTTQP